MSTSGGKVFLLTAGSPYILLGMMDDPRLASPEYQATGRRTMVLLSGGPLLDVYEPTLTLLDQRDPASASVMRTSLRARKEKVDGWREQAVQFRAENDAKNQDVQTINLDIEARISAQKKAMEAELAPLEAVLARLNPVELKARLEDRIASRRLRTLREARPKEVGALAAERGLSTPPDQPKTVGRVGNALVCVSGAVLGFGALQTLGQVDVASLKPAGWALAVGVSALGVMPVAGVKWVVSRCFANAAWNRQMKRSAVGYVLAGTAMALVLCALDVTIFRSGLLAANALAEYAAGPEGTGLQTSAYAVSLAVTAPAMAMAGVQGWSYGWRDLFDGEMECCQAEELRSRVTIEQIQAAEETAGDAEAFAEILAEEREKLVRDINLKDAYGNARVEDLESNLATYLAGFEEWQLKVLSAGAVDIILDVAKEDALFNAMVAPYLGSGAQKALLGGGNNPRGFWRRFVERLRSGRGGS